MIAFLRVFLTHAFAITPSLAFVVTSPGRIYDLPVQPRRARAAAPFLSQCVSSTNLYSTHIDSPAPSIWVPEEGEALLDEFDQIVSSSPTKELIMVALAEVTDPVKMKDYDERIQYWQMYKDGSKSLRDFFSEWLVYAPLPDNPGEYITYWDWLANTFAGIILTNEVQDFKDWFTRFLNLHGKFINSVDSDTSITLWMKYNGTTDHPFNIDWYNVPDEGFKTFNQFFLREVKPELRPLADECNIIASPNDGGSFILDNGGEFPGKHRDTFDIKDSFPCHGERFVGGVILNSLLWFTDYHYFTAPIDGKIISVNEYQGSYNYDFDDFDANHPYGPRPDATSDRVEWYNNLPTHKRLNWVIDTGREDVGLVGMSAIGFWGVGSITSSVCEGNKIKKGEPMGHFNYGGSSIVLVFEPKAHLDLVTKDEHGKTVPLKGPDDPVLVLNKQHLLSIIPAKDE